MRLNPGVYTIFNPNESKVSFLVRLNPYVRTKLNVKKSEITYCKITFLIHLSPLSRSSEFNTNPMHSYNPSKSVRRLQIKPQGISIQFEGFF